MGRKLGSKDKVKRVRRTKAELNKLKVDVVEEVKAPEVVDVPVE